MPITRSKKTFEARENTFEARENTFEVREKTFEDREKSAPASAAPMVLIERDTAARPRTTTSAMHIDEQPASTSAASANTVVPQRRLVTSTEGGQVQVPPVRASTRSVRSMRSTASTTARIRQAELDAEIQLAEMKQQELRLEAIKVKAKLERSVAMIREESERGSQIDEQEIAAETHTEEQQRVHDWLIEMEYSQPRGEGRRPPQHSMEPVLCARNAHASEREGRWNREARGKETELRPPSPIPNQRTSFHATNKEEDTVDRIAQALEKIVNKRPVPRQAHELPTFSGAATEWLPFKAAMRDSTAMYKYSDYENLARLRNCLRGKAQETVAALLYSATSPDEIMRTLEQCFGRPEMLIERAMEDIKKLPKSGTSAGELNTLAVKLKNIVCVLGGVDERGYLRNPMLTREVIEKLSPHLKSRWYDFAYEHGDPSEAEIATLSRFLEREADRAMRFSYATSPQSLKETFNNQEKKSFSRERPRKDVKVYATTETPTAPTVEREKEAVTKRCLCCGGNHDVPDCKKYKRMTVNERWQWVKEEKICFKCINGKHRRFTCKAKRCGIENCLLPHHSTLHMDTSPAAATQPKSPPVNEENVLSASATTSGPAKVLLKVCPVEIRVPGGPSLKRYALLDEGATITLMDEGLANDLGARGHVSPLHIHGATASQKETQSRVVKIEVRGQHEEQFHDITAHTVKQLTIGSQTVKRKFIEYEHLKHLPLDDMSYESARPSLLIGADNWHLIISKEILIGKRYEPIASRTELGWTIHGTVPRSLYRGEDQLVLHVHAKTEKDVRNFANEDEELNALIKTHYDVDALGIALITKPRKAEERAIDIFNKTIERVNGRYQVGLPWRDEQVVMPPSYEMAFRRLRTIERKMDQSPEFQAAYTSQIENLLTKGYAAVANGDERDNDKSWYLPHFAVTNPNKPGKVRLVFDAAAKSRGESLNDHLLDGPDLLRALPGILYRFREKEVAVTADIREMFLQVKIRPEDRPAQMFLWRGNERKKPPTEYVMSSMIFGARSSPFLAHSVRNHNARAHAETHPVALRAITESHYMDDFVESYATKEEATRAVHEVTYVHEQAGFILAGWNSSNEDVIRDIPPDRRAQLPKEMGTAGHQGKTLGLIWEATKDELMFNTALPRVPEEVKTSARPPTKREALSAVMSIFDPLGLLSHLTITAKILLQDLWRQQRIGWDDQVPEEAAEDFTKWIRAVDSVREVKLPRCYAPTRGVLERQLHVFNDASDRAYATVAYWRIKYENGEVIITLAGAKAKVAPLKAQSIPRLELQASLIGARLAHSIQEEHRQKADRIVLWSDSKTALHWIRNDIIKYTPYVAHRVGEIANLTHIEQWRWIPSELNVADDATRPNYEVRADQRWFIGPAFLREEEERWPSERTEEENDNGQDEIVCATDNSEGPAYLPDISRFSSYERLVRATAYVLLAVDKMKKRTRTLKLAHITKAEELWYKKMQEDSYSDEIERLKKDLKLRPNSALRKLDPRIDDRGLLTLHGRVGVARISEQSKSPLIMDGRHAFTRLLVAHAHKAANHANREQVVNDLKQKFYITRIRPTVRAVEHSCQLCKVKKARPRPQVHGDLPYERLAAHARPFSYTGLDFFGPMYVTVGRHKEKRWGALFTCLTTRAVHIEISPSLSTDSAIMCLRRMAARRGWPVTIYSDNGTNFHGADEELRAAQREWGPQLKDFALLQRTNWKYIAPGAPNQGGAWERLIRSVKTALVATLHERYPRDEVLATLLTEAEYTVNARPLTHVPVEPGDMEALTPNHFLLGTSGGLPTTGPCREVDRRTWRATQALADVFWRRWLTEYLPTLIPRGGTRSGRGADLKVGDVVIITDPVLPRNIWPRGEVIRLHQGPDGLTRVADVRTRGGIFRRPLRRLAVLPVKEGCEDLRRGEDVTDSREEEVAG
ncbi:uncharacterized protein LOC126381173 [Pectinophora gossypiella]|uniref:uncharacterized protein LOC126381173 n=1 Tax=Pectinophora gossypiella TaxID=13191 RepID=UPI00214F1C61|nr:uncharacterized protein LOC126381173 [Pectinophora gossypiella]